MELPASHRINSNQDSPLSIDEIYKAAQYDPDGAVQYLDQCIDALDSSDENERIAAAWAIKHIAFANPGGVADQYGEITSHLSVMNLDVTRPLSMAVGIASREAPYETVASHYNTYATIIEADEAVLSREWLLIPFSQIAYQDPSAAFSHVDTLSEILLTGDPVGKEYAAKTLEPVAIENPDLVVPYTNELRELWDSDNRRLRIASLPTLAAIVSPPVTESVPNWFFASLSEAVTDEDDELRAAAVEVSGFVIRRSGTAPDQLLEALVDRLSDRDSQVRKNAGVAWLLAINDHSDLVEPNESFASQLRSIVDEFDLAAENPSVVEYVFAVITPCGNDGSNRGDA